MSPRRSRPIIRGAFPSAGRRAQWSDLSSHGSESQVVGSAWEAQIAMALESCSKGHAYTKANTYVTSSGRRRCRECLRLIRRSWIARNYDHFREYQNEYRKKRQGLKRRQTVK